MGSSTAPTSVADHQLITDLLDPLLGPEAANAVALSLLTRFGSLGGVITAPQERLVPLLGHDSARIAQFLSAIRRVLVSTMRRRLEDRPLLSSHSHVVSYLKALLVHETIEHLRVLYLDVRLHLIVDELTSVGSINHAPVYPREIIRRALDLGAKNLMLVHNHPSGDATPSRADIASTRQVAASAAVFEIELLDHYVVGRSDVQSMKQLGLLHFGPLYVDYEPRGPGKAVVRSPTLAPAAKTKTPGRGARGRCVSEFPSP